LEALAVQDKVELLELQVLMVGREFLVQLEQPERRVLRDLQDHPEPRGLLVPLDLQVPLVVKVA